MKKILAMAVAASALAFSAPAFAQSWQSINARQANLDQRIDVGVRNGSLTAREATQLRAEFRDIARLEAHYRSSYGLSQAERRDLDRRFDALSQRIRYERNDWQDRPGRGNDWTPINQRQREIDMRIDAGRRDGSLSRAEASRLRADFQYLAQLEARYRQNGLSNRERRDLDDRFDRLEGRVLAERRDRNNYYG
ncbi:MAG: hypothetical protein AB7O98_13880 [Hyphomonadaceae bacterium]